MQCLAKKQEHDVMLKTAVTHVLESFLGVSFAFLLSFVLICVPITHHFSTLLPFYSFRLLLQLAVNSQAS